MKELPGRIQGKAGGLRPPAALRRLARRLLGEQRYAALKEARSRLVSNGRFYCPVCETRLMEFSTNPFGEISCPACGSFPRTRAMMFYLRRHLDERRPNRVLHIAPFWKKAEALSRIDGLTYITADMAWPGEGVYPWNSMMRMNMEDIPFADGFFDLVIAVSVMQFILRDGRAFSEVARVLRPGGVFVFELDVFGDRTEESYSDKELDVLEYGIKDGPVELFMTGKWKKDGKLLHDPRQYVRKYGMDIMDRAARAGFAVRQADLERFAPLERYGIRTSPHIFECTRTGSRT